MFSCFSSSILLGSKILGLSDFSIIVEFGALPLYSDGERSDIVKFVYFFSLPESGIDIVVFPFFLMGDESETVI